MNMYPSIFDLKKEEEISSFKLWNKKLDGFTLKDKLKGILIAFKKSKCGEKYDSRPFFITHSGFLYYKKNINDKKIRGVMELKWARAIFKVVEGALNQFYCELKLVKNKKQTTLFLKDQNSMEEWGKCLKLMTAFSSFHQDYEVLDLIGKGAFSKVNIFLLFSCIFLANFVRF